MEVFIRDVPEQVTENGLRTLLQPYMKALSIDTYYCQKQRHKRIAFLVFLNIQDGNRFLVAYGQDKPARFDPKMNHKIKVLQTPIYCVISKKSPNQHVLKSLEKDQKDLKKLKTKTGGVKDSAASTNSREFRSSSVSCGVWSYVGPDLVFVPYALLAGGAAIKFGPRELVVKFDSGDRIEFPYYIARGLTMEDQPQPSFTIQLWNAPRFYKELPTDGLDFIISQTAKLSFNERQQQDKRTRVSNLSPSFAEVAGTCFVYRISLDRAATQATSNFHKLAANMRALQDIPAMPPISHRQVDIYHSKSSYLKDFKSLEATFQATQSLPWKIKFQIRLLISNGYLTPAQTLSLLPELSFLASRRKLSLSVATIKKFRNSIPFPGSDVEAKMLSHDALADLLKNAEDQAKNDDLRLAIAGGPDPSKQNLASIHRAFITPSGMWLEGPVAEPLNRVLRKYPDHHEYFLRVSFGEEDGEPLRYNPRVSNELIYNDRFRSILRNGINIAGRQFNFLGFSHSSLRAQSCWFMAAFTHGGSLLFDRPLIKQLGDFTKIRCPAKCAARIGQAFSETPTAITFPSHIFDNMADVERNDRVFSDGVGTISRSVMEKIWAAVPSMLETKPTCFQIRFQGAKGMLSLDTRLFGDRVMLRPSMIKFEGSTSMDIELCGYNSRPLPMYLNRQIIKILEDMGVPNTWFLDLQSQEVERLSNITASAANAAKFLKSQSIGEPGHLSWLIKKLASMELEFRDDRFLRDVLEISVMMQVRVMKYRARIPVPSGMTLYGILDETGILEEGQIYCPFTTKGKKNILLGENLIITRAPALHPGDVQLVEAVSVPPGSPLLNLTNCICFSQKGERDLPSKLSGGDLDGDLFNIIWDPGCQPTHYCLPADYPRGVPQDIGRTVEKEDMTDFFVKFMETDQLGRIATTHQVVADQEDNGTSDPKCKKLAELHSTAVDFSKTGVPVNIREIPKPSSTARPDFMAPGPNVKIEKKEGLFLAETKIQIQDANDDDDFTPYRYYESNKALGQLFRAIDEHNIFSDLHKYRMNPQGLTMLLGKVWDRVSQQCRMVPWHKHIPEMTSIRDMYEENLLAIMKEYSEHPSRPISELEAFIGNILGTAGVQSRKQRDLSMPMKEAYDRDVRYFVSSIRGEDDDGEPSEDALGRSIACFSVSLGEVKRVSGGRGESLVSFRYVAAAVCLREVESVFGG